MTPAGSSLRSATGAATATPTPAHQQVFPAHADQVHHARAFLVGILAGRGAADDAVLCLSELASNSVVHSASRQPGGTFTVRATFRHGGRLRVEVEDQGGPWGPCPRGDGQHGHGLHIVSQLASNWGVTGDSGMGWIVWFDIACPITPPADIAPPGGPQVRAATPTHPGEN
jgi:serine/threonine-protein kinase RsbW